MIKEPVCNATTPEPQMRTESWPIIWASVQDKLEALASDTMNRVETADGHYRDQYPSIFGFYGYMVAEMQNTLCDVLHEVCVDLRECTDPEDVALIEEVELQVDSLRGPLSDLQELLGRFS